MKPIVFCFFILVSYGQSIAQCAMCKAGAEQSLERGSTAVHWINYAIIFLMSIPLILIFSLYMLHRQNQKKNQNEISS